MFVKERSFYFISRIILLPLARPLKDSACKTLSSFLRPFTFSHCIWDERMCLNFNLAFELVIILTNHIPKSLIKRQA